MTLSLSLSLALSPSPSLSLSLSLSRAPGEDGVPNELLAALDDETLTALLPLFDDILSGTSPIPHSWRRSILILIPKCSQPEPEDHLPISLLPRLFGLFESLLWKRLLRKGGPVELLSPEQGGCRPVPPPSSLSLSLHPPPLLWSFFHRSGLAAVDFGPTPALPETTLVHSVPRLPEV